MLKIRLLSAIDRERESKGLDVFVNAFYDIWNCAFNCQNEEIAKYAIYNITWIISDFAKEPNNEKFIERFLRLMVKIINKGTSSHLPDLRDYSLTAATCWYTHMLRIKADEDATVLSFIDSFNKEYFECMKVVIQRDQKELFKFEAANLVNGFYDPLEYDDLVERYVLLLKQSDGNIFDRLNKSDKIYHEAEQLDQKALSVLTFDEKQNGSKAFFL